MTSLVPPSPHIPQSLRHRRCAVRGCAELVTFGQFFCGHHHAMRPCELTEALTEANREFLAAAAANDMARAKAALERGLTVERNMRLAIEAMEAGQADQQEDGK